MNQFVWEDGSAPEPVPLSIGKRSTTPARAPAPERLLPQSIEAESGILGCILLSPNECMAECIAKLRPGPSVFYDLRHQEIYKAFVQMFEAKQAIDTITVLDHFKNRGGIEQVGGLAYVAGLPDTVPSAANLGFYLDTVLEKYLLRQLAQHCSDFAGKVYDHHGEADDLIEQFESSAMSIANSVQGEADSTIKELVKDRLSFYEQCEIRGGGLLGLSTGYPDLDRMIDGMKPAEMIVIAARPSVGKTTLAMNIAENLAIDQKIPVGVFSLEMSREALVGRMISSRSRVNERTLTRGKSDDADKKRIFVHGTKVAHAPIFIDDTGGMTITQLRAKARRMVQKEGTKLFVIDYVQLLRSARNRPNQQEEMSDVSKGVKAMTKELKVPVIAICQLNREIEKERNRKPRMSDLRECLSVKESLLFTSSGVQYNMDSLMNTYCLNTGNIGLKDSENIPKREAETIQLNMSSGRSVICTPSHLMLTDRGWVEARKITRDHAIAATRRLQEPDGTIPIPEAKWIGWMLGNGSTVGYSSPSFICSCSKVASDFCAQSKLLFGVDPKPHKHRCKKVYQFDLTASTVRTPEGNPVTKWLKSHDLWGRRSYEKVIPQWFMEQADNTSISELLAGLYETDGSVFLSPCPVVKFSTTSKLMAMQVIWLLNRLGVFGRIDDGLMNAKSNYKCYSITIKDGTEIERFRRAVRLVGRKGGTLESIKAKTRGSNQGDRVGGWVSREIGKISKQNNISWRSLGYRDQGRRISQAWLKRVITRFSELGINNGRLIELAQLVNENIFWDRMKSVSSAGKQPVFDRYVPEAANFICNGIIVHNSGQLEQDADIIGMLYSTDPDPDSKEIIPVNLLIVKQRNGPRGDVPLVLHKTITRFESASRFSPTIEQPPKTWAPVQKELVV